MAEPQETTSSQLHSLRIDPDRKLPRRGGMGSLFLVVLGVAIGLALAFGLNQPSPAPGEKGAAPTGESAGNGGPGDASAAAAAPAPPVSDTVLSATGYITPRQRISLSPEVQGRTTLVPWRRATRSRKATCWCGSTRATTRRGLPNPAPASPNRAPGWRN